MSRSPSPRLLAVTGLLAVVLVAAGVAATGTAPSEPTAIGECTTITESGHYVIEHNRTYSGTVGSTACITVRADDVVLDGRGTTFDGRGISNTTGIRVAGASNVTVRNLTVTDWHEGVHYVDATGGTVRDVHVSQSPYGVTVERSTDVTVADSRFTRNLVGVRLKHDRNTTLRNNTFRDSHGEAVHRTAGPTGSG